MLTITTLSANLLAFDSLADMDNQLRELLDIVDMDGVDEEVLDPAARHQYKLW